MTHTVSSRIHSDGFARGLRMLPELMKTLPPGRSARVHASSVCARSG